MVLVARVKILVSEANSLQYREMVFLIHFMKIGEIGHVNLMKNLSLKGTLNGLHVSKIFFGLAIF